MLNEQITSHLNKELLLTRWYGSAGNGMSDEDDNFLPVLDKDSELIATSLLDRPNIKSGSYQQQIYDVCNEGREALPLDWDNCVTYSSDNTNSMVRQRNSLLQKIRSVQGDQKIALIIQHMCVLERERKNFL